MSETEEAIAAAALERYDVDVTRWERLATSYNTFFSVDAADGSRFALRVSSSRRRGSFERLTPRWGWTSARRRAGAR